MNLQTEFLKRPTKQKTLEITAYIGSDPARFAELIKLVLSGEDPVNKYAAWHISHYMEENPQLLDPHLKPMVENLGKGERCDSVIRSTLSALAKIASIPVDLQGPVLQYSFDILLDSKKMVSIQVHAMQVVFNISKNEPDLLQELKMVIEERMPHGTTGYKARGRRILGEIRKLLSRDQR